MPIQRIVCFKFKESATEADRKAHMVSFAALKQSIPQILSYSGGFGICGDFRAAPQYDTLHYMTFASMEDVDAYFEHAAHKQFIEANKHAWDDVLVLNADLDRLEDQ